MWSFRRLSGNPTLLQELFQEKDYLNGRFFHKRAYYLSVIAAHIKQNLPVDVFYDSTNNDPRLSSLSIEPKEGWSDFCTFLKAASLLIQIHPSLTFPVLKRGYAFWQRWPRTHQYLSDMSIQLIAISESRPLEMTSQLAATTMPFCNPPPQCPTSYPLTKPRRVWIAFQTPSLYSESGLTNADIVVVKTVGAYSDLKTVAPSGWVY